MNNRWKLISATAIVLAIGLVAVSRPRVASVVERVRDSSDSYVLPPPNVLVAASLGHRAAIADFLWAHVLVTQGILMGHHRPYLSLPKYLDAIATLDPHFRAPYRLADTLLAFQMNDPNREASVRLARRFLERGLRNRPYDAELWLNYGDFLAYIGPGGLKDPKEQAAWRKDAAHALGKAIELLGEDDRVFKHGIAGFTLLNNAGKTGAAIRFLERAYAMTDDEQVRGYIEKRLHGLRKGKQASEQFRVSKRFAEYWRHTYPFVGRSALLLLGPRRSVWGCAGQRAARGSSSCDVDWVDWHREALEAVRSPEALAR